MFSCGQIGWGRSVTPLGEVYYVNHANKTTTWTRPTWEGDEDEDGEFFFSVLCVFAVLSCVIFRQQPQPQ